ncbi:MAG: tetratricopeptide repeat protein [Candidatus Kapabacteria bacterium]|nr:tetratricopeptide repeat protein [Candidatus Kapabacteria bacterium]
MKKRELNQEDESLIQAGVGSSDSQESGIPNFIQKNGKIIIGLSLLVIIIIGITIFLKNKSENDSARASVLLTRVMEYYEKSEFDKALNGDPTRTYMGEQVKGLKYIADEFGNTDQGKIAALYAANAFLNTNKKAEAKKYFEIAEGSPADVVKQGAHAGIAAGLELDGKYAEAAKHYLEASELADEDNIISRYKFYAGLCFEKSGDKKQAESLYKEIIKLNEMGEFSSLAKAGLTRIGTIIE